MRSPARKTRSTLLAALLSAALLFSSVPGTAFAEDVRPEVDGEKVECTADPVEVSEQIGAHLEEGQLDPDGSEYQTKRIIVSAEGDIEDSCGAQDALYNKAADDFVLEYKTEADTERAYEALAGEYGSENVFVDQVVSIDASSGSAGSGSVSWGTRSMGLDRLKAYANRNPKLKNRAVVAVLDTGVNPWHAMFRGRTFLSSSRGFIYDGGSWIDGNGHGSHVTGIIADGTSRHVSFMILRVMDNSGQGSLYNVLQAVDYASKKGADVINLSLGLKNFPKDSSAYKVSEKYLKRAQSRGAMVVVSAGNIDYDGITNIDKGRCYPATSKYAVTVSAITSKRKKAYFSMYGRSVDFCAPGASIISAWWQGTDQYARVDGTSMAAPGISAAAAMIRVYHPKYSFAKVYRVLREQAVDLGAKGKDSYYGYGLVHIGSPVETTIRLKVPATTIHKLKKGRARFKVTWKKAAGVSGYQIRYSRKASMKGAKKKKAGKSKASLTVKKLTRKKTYYVQVRCYKKANGYTYYSAWSKKKKVRVK